MYHAINEEAARRAKEMNSFYDYQKGSATSEYRSYVEKAEEIAAAQKMRVDPMYHEKIDHLLESYCRKLADNMNDGFRIEMQCPSIMIAGPSNFPARKKEKQNAARNKNMEEWNYIQGLLDKIRSVGTGGISSDDPAALTKLKAKLDDLEKSQERMKAANAYYRKNKSLDGCPHLSPEVIEKLKESMLKGYHLEGKPFATYALTNNNATIRNTKMRIAELEKRAEKPLDGGWKFDGGEVVYNNEINRLQVIFDGKPDADVRAELKANGFKWAPSQNAWQRQLTQNAIYAAKNYVKSINQGRK